MSDRPSLRHAPSADDPPASFAASYAGVVSFLAVAEEGMHGMSIRLKDTTPGCEVTLYKPNDA